MKDKVKISLFIISCLLFVGCTRISEEKVLEETKSHLLQSVDRGENNEIWFFIDDVKVIDQKRIGESEVFEMEVKGSDNSGNFKRYYKVNYIKPKDENEFLIDEITEFRQSEWEYELEKGIEEPFIIDSLNGELLINNTEELMITESELEEINIVSHETDLTQGLDYLEIELLIRKSSRYVKARIEVTYEFLNNQWVLNDIKLCEDIDIIYDDTIEEITEEKIIKELKLHDILLNTDIISSCNIIEETTLDYGQNKKVKLKIIQKNDICEIITYIEMILDIRNGKWELIQCEINDQKIDYSLEGLWVGSYDVGGGESKLELTINEVSEAGGCKAIFTFGTIPGGPNIPLGAYEMDGKIDLDTGEISLKGTQWIEKPGTTWYFVDILDGKLILEEGKIKSEDNELEVVKQPEGVIGTLDLNGPRSITTMIMEEKQQGSGFFETIEAKYFTNRSDNQGNVYSQGVLFKYYDMLMGGTEQEKQFRILIDGKYNSFETTVALDAESANLDKSARINIYADNNLIYTAEGIQYGHIPEKIKLDITGVQELRFEIGTYASQILLGDAVFIK